MASSIETTSTTTTLKNNGNTYATVDTNDDVVITNDLAVSGTLNTTGAVVHNEAGAAVDFRVEGDTQPFLLFTSGTEDTVTIGGSTSSLFNGAGTNARLAVIGSSNNTNLVQNGSAAIAIVNTDQTDENTAGLHFARADTDDTPNYAGASIVAQFKETQATGQYPSATMNFLTSTTQNAAPTTKMTLTEAGNLGIGTTGPQAKIDIRDDIDESSTYTGQLAINSVTKSTGNLARMMFSHDDHGSASIASDYESSGNGNLIFSTRGGGNPTERMRIAANGKVGIGIAAAVYPLDVYGVIGIKDGESLTWKGNAQHSASIVGSGSAARVSIWTSANERMRVHSNGVVSIGSTAATAKFNIYAVGGSTAQIQNNIAAGTNAIVQIGFLNDNGLVGSIQSSGTSTSYVTSSDYRLKENVQYEWSATERLKKLKPARFNFIADAEKTFDGFLAHEAQEVVPEAVTGVKDEMADAVLYVKGDELPKGKKIGDIKEESKPVMQGIDQAKLVPLLVKTIQELEARIAKLEENK